MESKHYQVIKRFHRDPDTNGAKYYYEVQYLGVDFWESVFSLSKRWRWKPIIREEWDGWGMVKYKTTFPTYEAAVRYVHKAREKADNLKKILPDDELVYRDKSL